MISLLPQTLDYEILINGMNPRNRAFHGDRVAVKLFPESLWKRRTATGREAGEYMPTGEPADATLACSLLPELGISQQSRNRAISLKVADQL